MHLATAIEQAAEGIVITDKSGTVHYTNPAFERISDYTQKEIIGQNTKILRSEHHPASFYKSMWKRIASGKVWSGRIRTKKKYNTTCELEVTISPIRDSKNNIISFVSVNRDVTREIQMEKELHQAQKMEAIGTLAGGIAHDFNNILSAIIGYTELALLDLPPENISRTQLEEVLTAGNRAKALVEQILTFSRQHEQKMEPLRVAPIVKEALKLLRASLPATIEILTK
ncbi:MAG: PAS domain S-box protein, partial [Deltaproteobacteria bacterium]|nr:PAS domain S-box protein [Deltaproteobacteria bacterium]